MNGNVSDTDTREQEASCPLWERLGCARAARFCRRRLRRVAPEGNGKTRSRDSRRPINRPPSAIYSGLSERVRTKTPAALQCALFCGGARCQYELPRHNRAAIQGVYSDWVTDDILAMARPSTASIAARNIIQQFHSWGIRTVINLQIPGEHASCGPPLTKSGFTYDPNIFMANDIYYYNFAWPDYGEASLSGLLDMAKVISFALQEGRVAIHCHAARFLVEPFKGVCKCQMKLHGKTALITGGNSGIGLETARDLARRGARVIIASRNVKKSEEAVASIKKTTGNQNVEHRYLNLGKKDCIVKFAEEFNKDFDRLDILVNNAGCGAVKRTTAEGIDLLMQINYIGPFTLTNRLLDKLITSKPSRIVNVSSLAHRFTDLELEDLVKCRTTSHIVRYSKTKLCDVLWTRALAKKLPSGVTANVLHPGLVKTNIFNNFQPYVKKILFLVIDLLYKTPIEGAQTIIHLCVSSELENATGGYYMDCVKIEPSKIAQDDDLAEKVWNRTLELIKE